MDIQTIMTLCEQYPGVTADYPFGPQTKCYRVGGRIFAQICPDGIPGALTILREDDEISRDQLQPMATLSCEPYFGDYYRELYKGLVCRPYHCPLAQQPYANTLFLDPALPDALWRELIEHAYDTIFAKLTKKIQTEIRSQSERNTEDVND